MLLETQRENATGGCVSDATIPMKEQSGVTLGITCRFIRNAMRYEFILTWQ